MPYAVSSITEMGYELLYLPASLAHNIAESGACFGVALRSKDEKVRSTAISSGVSALFGITEPALYGLTIQNKNVLASVMSGSFVGAIFIGLFGVRAYAAVGPGLASISMFISEELPRNILFALIGALISFIISFVLGMMLWKEKREEQEEEIENTDESLPFVSDTVLLSHAQGELISLDEVNDDMFSQRLLGEGIAIIPEKGELYAPVAGTVEVVFHTNHAIAIKSDAGQEILLHVGINTVQLEGKYFYPQVKVGDRVKVGDLLLKFDLEKIQEEGYDPVIPVVITNMESGSIIPTMKGSITLGKQSALLI